MTPTPPASVWPWLRENAVSLTVLIALGSGIFYLGSTLASKADVANTASKADVEDLGDTVREMQADVADTASKADVEDLGDTVREMQADVANTASKADVEDLGDTVREMQASFDTAVDGLNETVNSLNTTVAALGRAVDRLGATADGLNETSRVLVTCIVDVHHSWRVAYLRAARSWVEAGRDLVEADLFVDPPELPENCEGLRSR